MSQKRLDLHGGWQVQLGHGGSVDVDVHVLWVGINLGELGDLVGVV